jgi:hypothetical protein
MSSQAPPTTVDLTFFGRPVAVDAGELVDVVRRLWRPFLSVSDETAGVPIELVIPAELATAATRLGWLNSTLNSVAMELTPQLAVHAGVVRYGDVVLAFPAKSGVGKSTMTGACLRQGFEYVSDEALCLDYDDGLVHPYPRPIGLSAASAGLLAVTGCQADDDLLVEARDLGAASATVDERPRLTHLVLLNRIGRGAASLAPAPRHEAIEAVLRTSFNHFQRPADALRLVAATVAASHVHTLTYASAPDAAMLLAQTFVPAMSSLVAEIPHA